ncbi:related to phospholipase [Cephalotrichum gorgonifer]|uniref:Related to phospholipase n=1 Tax=Cephalotrichum gorgonifer TaxID=2041049 RepID=A0AAE8STM6_9PEZI|nr:related to phospholipase [Cephalotrichum gorgonifer]
MTTTTALRELIASYNELNPPQVEELHEEPSPLEFMRYVARNAPFVVRGGARGWEAYKRWDREFLAEAMRGMRVNVAVTPRGNADAPTRTADGDLVLAKPHEEERDFEEFLDYVISQEKNPSSKGEIRYAQTQNDNLRDEYSPLAPHLPASPPFAHIALDRAPDALNLWIGNSRSVTALHRDNYENIYVQVRGRKHFVLLPALCAPVVQEAVLPPARYNRRPREGPESAEGGAGLVLETEEGEGSPFPTWDPDGVSVGGREGGDGEGEEVKGGEFEDVVQPLRVTLDPGDMLYLPAMWYHKVAQSCRDDDEGFVLAVNYW